MEEINLNYQMEMKDQKSIIKQYETKLLELEKELRTKVNLINQNFIQKNTISDNRITMLNERKKYDNYTKLKTTKKCLAKIFDNEFYGLLEVNIPNKVSKILLVNL